MVDIVSYISYNGRMKRLNNLMDYVRDRCDLAEDTELEQAIKIRLTLGVLLIGYFAFPWGSGLTYGDAIIAPAGMTAIIYYLGALTIAAAILINPKPSPARRVSGLLLDMGALSVVIYLAESKAVIVFALYLWVILGMGFRYGVKYLYMTMFAAITGFSIVLFTSDYWQGSHQPIGLGLLLLLFVVPIYSAFLVNKLRAATASAKEANEAKSRFLANMSHELRTPLNGVIGIADLLSETDINEQQDEFVKIMKGSANTLLGLIENVLDISKIEAGKITIAKEAYQLDDLVASVMRIQRPMGESKGLSVRDYIDPEVPLALNGDAQHIKQVLINIMGNAIKFTEKGSVHLSVTQTNKVGQTPRLRFEIADTGIGITQEALPTIFDGFTRTRQGELHAQGTGLGTTIAKEIVELMEGKIGIKSVQGQGSTFWFELPMDQSTINDAVLSQHREENENTELSLADHYAEQSDGRTLTVLIAEDNAVNQQVLEGVLKHAGHKTLLAKNGDEALDILADKMDEIDLAILDVNMPIVSGLEVARNLRFMDTSARIPVIMLTADATPETKTESEDAGANAFLTKPVDARALLTQIAALSRSLPEHTPTIKGANDEQQKAALSVAKISNYRSDGVEQDLNVSIIKELEKLGDDGFMQKLVTGFEGDGRDQVALIKKGAHADFFLFREGLHALKGSAREMGAVTLARLCVEGESHTVGDVATEKAIALSVSIEHAFERTLQALQKNL